MATNLPFCFFIQFLAQLLKFLANFTLLKCGKSQRSYGFLITEELIFGFQILDLEDHFSASLIEADFFSGRWSGVSGRWSVVDGQCINIMYYYYDCCYYYVYYVCQWLCNTKKLWHIGL